MVIPRYSQRKVPGWSTDGTRERIDMLQTDELEEQPKAPGATKIQLPKKSYRI